MRQLKITNKITNRESISLDKYLNDISKIEMILPEDETILAKKIKLGDNEALEHLTRANLRFVVSVAKQYQNQGLSLIDLINEGNIGLMKAARRFDETKGFKFISYAVWWIRQSILQAIVDHSRLVRLPLNKVGSYNKVNDALVDFMQKNERDPSHEELAELLEMKPVEIFTMIQGGKRHLSFDTPVGNEDGDASMIDLFVDIENSPDESLMDQSKKKDLFLGLEQLSQREKDVLRDYYGLEGGKTYTLEEIGELYGLTRERVRQIKERAIRRLRKSGNSDDLRSYL